ncbi:LppA family lipoprotein [Antrihabitans spumae]|uniref:LppA family lipoprotein n=1 Tax=Antrihabitans spumae TaxID=3373370 RepID=A0ABW7KAA0_9NOCA
MDDEERLKIKIAELRSQPSLEETERLLNDTVGQITDAATGIVGTLRWEQVQVRNQGLCGHDYRDTGGLDVFLPHIRADRPVPEENWSQVLEAAREIARQAGITEMQIFSDVPGNREVRMYGENGNAITIGYRGATVISGRTGCRLPAADLAQPPS